jgi:hypothetical protein
VRIALINASPKIKESASGALINDFLACSHEKCECTVITMNKPTVTEEMTETLKSCEAWVFFYPVYVDGVPGHVLSCLRQLEARKNELSGKNIYAVPNCGFYDGKQCEPSIEVISHWSRRAGNSFGGGVGIGGGGALTALLRMKPGSKPRCAIDKSLFLLVNSILEKKAIENIYESVAMPRALYKLIAEIGWSMTLKKNGKKRKDIAATP